MAYQQDFNQEEENKNQTPGEQVLSGDNSPVGAPAGSGASSGSEPIQQKGTGFTNLSTYVNANKEQSADMAGGITGDIRSQLGEANTGLNELSKTVESDADKNTVKDSGVISQLGSDPTQVNAENYNKQTSGYAGKSDVSEYEPYQDLSQKFKSVDTKEKSLSDPNAIGVTLREKYNKPSYTQGENTLDSFLTTSGAGADTLKGFQNEYEAQNPMSGFTNTSNSLNSKLGSAKQTTNETANATKAAYDSALANRQAALNSAKNTVSSESESVNKNAAQLRSELNSGNSAAAQQVGLSPEQIGWLRDHQYSLDNLVESTPGRSLGDVANQNDVSAYLALLGLNPGQQSQYDFSKTGNAIPTTRINQDLLNQYTNAYTQAIAPKGQFKMPTLSGGPIGFDASPGLMGYPSASKPNVASTPKQSVEEQLRGAMPVISPSVASVSAVGDVAKKGINGLASKKTVNHKK